MLLRYHLRPDRTTAFVNTCGTRPAASYVLVFRPARKGSCFGPFRASSARVFRATHLPELRTDLVAGLAGLDVDDLAHFGPETCAARAAPNVKMAS